MNTIENYTVNTLVRHKKLTSLGIGCVSKVLAKSLRVNFGSKDVMTCRPTALTPVDTSKCKVIHFNEFKTQTIANAVKSTKVIIGNEVKEWVGIGWTSLGIVTLADLSKYPRLID